MAPFRRGYLCLPWNYRMTGIKGIDIYTFFTPFSSRPFSSSFLYTGILSAFLQAHRVTKVPYPTKASDVDNAYTNITHQAHQ